MSQPTQSTDTGDEGKGFVLKTVQKSSSRKREKLGGGMGHPGAGRIKSSERKNPDPKNGDEISRLINREKKQRMYVRP